MFTDITDEGWPDDAAPLVPEEMMLSEEQVAVLFKKMDKNADGKINLDEIHSLSADMRVRQAESGYEDALRTMDGDADGKVSLDEVLHDFANEAERAGAKRLFAAADKNRDGFLVGRELSSFTFPEIDEAVERAHAQGEVQRRDRNGDGKLDMQEFYSVEGDGSANFGEWEQEEFKELDSDGDGLLEAREIQAVESGRHYADRAMVHLVEVADADQDGFVTLEEIGASRSQLHEHEAGFHLHSWARQLEL